MPSTCATRLRPHPLHAAFALALACTMRPLDAAPVPASMPRPLSVTTVVANCNDSGTGSLREAVTNAVSGETIDVSQLGCSRISLTTGSLVTAAENLNVVGPGIDGLTLDGAYNGGENLFFHLGGGTLDIESMTLANGQKYRSDAAALGGCVYSNGSVTLSNAALVGCEARSAGVDNVALGGAVYVVQDLLMIDSVISGGLATNPDAKSRGGGAYVRGSLIAKYSTIADNAATNVNYAHFSLGGGVFVYRQALILNSTLSGNYAGHMGAMFAGAGSAYPVEIDNSTITDNRAVAWAGVFANADTKLQNSTIAFNHAIATTYGGGAAGVGLHVHGSTLDMESSIISNNTNRYGGSANELALDTGTLLGTDNLVVSSNVALPPGTLSIDPMLGPLRNNGGLTRTRVPMTGSPVIDLGNNVQGTAADQRGSGYPRTLGAAPDIGAVESPGDDDIFWDGFDGR
jgi:hypothetical protein